MLSENTMLKALLDTSRTRCDELDDVRAKLVTQLERLRVEHSQQDTELRQVQQLVRYDALMYGGRQWSHTM